jgi:hypothetical protein
MRLINCTSLQLEEFYGANVPDYVILSHRWEEEEVSFADFTRNQATAKAKLGFRKIDLTCRQALKDGWHYAWIDTCCINKCSSAELSEAINSMFSWYESSKTCYVYLSDVRQAQSNVQFPRSGWFARGWTLQELLAPESVQFFDHDWKTLGTKKEHSKWISEITGIDQSVLGRTKNKRSLEYDVEVGSFCVAKRMSWASHRETTRVEDAAYALLGIFNINMPLLYGEGMRAFTRLQEEILKTCGDNSILAWGLDIISQHPAGLIPDIATKSCLPPFCQGNVLASSPRDFENCRNLAHVSDTKDALSMSSTGLQLEIPLIKFENECHQYQEYMVGVLSCSITPDNLVGIILRRVSAKDATPLKVVRQQIFMFCNGQRHNAVVVGPRAVASSETATLLITPKNMPLRPANVTSGFQGHRGQICINKSDILRRTGYSCTGGKLLGAYGDWKRTEHEWWHWDSTTNMLSIDRVFGCETLVSFRFESPHRFLNTDAGFTLYMHTKHKRVWLFRNDLTRNAHDENLYEQMVNDSFGENTQGLNLCDGDSVPFRLRVTIEEKEVFRWRIFQINVDAELMTRSDRPRL